MCLRRDGSSYRIKPGSPPVSADPNVSLRRKNPRLLFTIVCRCRSEHRGNISASYRTNSKPRRRYPVTRGESS